MTEHGSKDDARLDAILADWTTPPASAGLQERIVATARARPRKAAPGIWWAGAGGVGLAGAVAGALIAAVLTTGPAALSPSADAAYAAGATVFGDLDEGSES